MYILELNVQKLYNCMFKSDIVAIYLRLTTSVSTLYTYKVVSKGFFVLFLIKDWCDVKVHWLPQANVKTMYQKSTRVQNSIANNYSGWMCFIFMVKAYYELLSFWVHRLSWMHITECPLVSTVSAFSVCTLLRMSAFCCVSCKINHYNYETWVVTGFTRNMSMCPCMFNKKATFAPCYGRRRIIFMRGGSSTGWGQIRSTGKRVQNIQHPLHASNLPEQPLLLQRSKLGCDGWWGEHALFGPRAVLPGDCSCCKINCFGQDSLPIYEREERPEMKDWGFLLSTGNGIDLLLLFVAQLWLYKKKTEDCKKTKLMFLLLLLFVFPGPWLNRQNAVLHPLGKIMSHVKQSLEMLVHYACTLNTLQQLFLTIGKHVNWAMEHIQR